MTQKDIFQLSLSSDAALQALLIACSEGETTTAQRLILQLQHLIGSNDGVLAKATMDLAEMGFFDQANTLVRGWLSKHKGVWSERALALLEFKRGKVDEGLACLAKLCEDHPKEPAAYSTSVEYLINANRLQQALALVEQALPLFPNDIWLLNHSARLAERCNDLATAFARWKKLYQIKPTHLNAREGIARILIHFRKFSEVSDLLLERPFELGAIPVCDLEYRCPSDLMRVPTVLRRGLVIGSCLAAGFSDIFESENPKCDIDFILVNNLAVLPPAPPHPPANYDFQFIQIPLRAIVKEEVYFQLRYDNPISYEIWFEDACNQLGRIISDYLKWNIEHGILTFVSNFLLPQQNAMGRLLPSNDLRNLVFFVTRLNEYLVQEVALYKNVYIIDSDQIASCIGRRHIQEDMLWVSSHASALSDFDYIYDQNRLESLHRASSYYPVKIQEFITMIWREIEAMYRSVHQIDMVKLVLVDLDDTLWRGVLAESGFTKVEGWPLGFAEALMFLKQRGIILGIVSKNTEARIIELWPYKSLLPLDAFAVQRINWLPKAENISEMLAEVNLLPGSVLYIDDNPIERESISQSFPEMRVIGSNPYLLRRVLLWSAETQVATITAESSKRSEMIKAQTKREQKRKVMSRGDFLSSMNVKVEMQVINKTDDLSFARCLELLNKTNQFNTTGVRWKLSDADAYFLRGGEFKVMHVSDRLTSYGIVGILCVCLNKIDQFVMSCRVVGLDVEFTAVALTLKNILAMGFTQACSIIIETPTNLLSRTIWQQCGFTLHDGLYTIDLNSATTQKIQPDGILFPL